MNGKLRQMATVYIRKNDEMLMLYRIGSKVVKECWCGVGGHFEKREVHDAKAAVLREMREEIGLHEDDLEHLSLRYLALRLADDELRMNYYFFADLKDSAKLSMKCSEGILQWIELKELAEKDMPLSARYCLEHYLTEGIHTEELYSVTVGLNNAAIHPIERFER